MEDRTLQYTLKTQRRLCVALLFTGRQNGCGLFIDGRLLFAKLNMLWWLYWSSIAAIDPDFAEVM